jgi:hypothetical protein
MSSEILDPHSLFDVLFENYVFTQPCIVYMGIGTHCNSPPWDFKSNQQFPIFLHDWKINNSDIPIKIILFDEMTVGDPYIVTDTSAFYSDTFIRDERYSNVYRSYLGIEVYSFAMNVKWRNDKFNMDGKFDMTDLVIDIVSKVSKSNCLFFFHEFTGRNPSNLESFVKESVDYDETKICIDISRGRDLSCFVDFSEPENFPLINLSSDKISWLNSKMISSHERELLLGKFKNKTLTLSDSPYNNIELFEFCLYRQIKNTEEIICKICRQIIYQLRMLFNKDLEFTKKDESDIIDLSILKSKVDGFTPLYNRIFDNVSTIKLAMNATSNRDIIYSYKMVLIQNLYDVIELCIMQIKKIQKHHFTELFLEFDGIVDKCKLINIFRKFCSEREIFL